MPDPKDSKRTYTDRIRTAHDDKRRILDLSETNLVPPDVGIFDEPTRCYRVNKEWATIIMGMVNWLAHPAVWRDATDWSFPAIAAINSFKVGEDCTGVRLRQSPTNPCHLEQSFDGGVSWEFAFDYSLCLANDSARIQYESAKDSYGEIEAAYDGTIASVAPNVIGDASSYDEIRQAALCDVVTYTVNTFCDTEIQRRNLVGGVSIGVGFIIAIIAAFITIASGFTATPLALFIISALVSGSGGAFAGISDQVLSDQAARDDVICCMFNGMDVIGFDRDQFEHSLDGCGFTAGTPEAQVAGAISSYLTEDDVWMLFLHDYEDSLRDAELGIINCPCQIGRPFVTITFEDPFEYNVQEGVVTNAQGNPNNSLATTDFGGFLQSIVYSRYFSPQFVNGVAFDIYGAGSGYCQITVATTNETLVLEYDLNFTANAWNTQVQIPIDTPQTIDFVQVKVYRSSTSNVTYYIDNINLY